MVSATGQGEGREGRADSFPAVFPVAVAGVNGGVDTFCVFAR